MSFYFLLLLYFSQNLSSTSSVLKPNCIDYDKCFDCSLEVSLNEGACVWDRNKCLKNYQGSTDWIFNSSKCLNDDYSLFLQKVHCGTSTIRQMPVSFELNSFKGKYMASNIYCALTALSTNVAEVIVRFENFVLI